MDFVRMRSNLLQKIEALERKDFAAVALEVFHFQAVHNQIYAQFLELLKIDLKKITSILQIPFLPISLFKNNQIQTGTFTPAQVFTSSGTTGESTSRHLVANLDWYQRNSEKAFANFYGPVEEYCFLALLPAYLEREGSSLIYMAQHFIQQSNYKQSDFFLYNHADLAVVLEDNRKANIPTILLGVSFALLDFAEAYPMSLENVIIMETGGMKGRRQEITRQELHAALQQAFQVKSIHSEYGMTELLSQAYSKGKGKFTPSPTMQVLAREVTDPFTWQRQGKTGVLNIIDLANLDSCSFIATEDLGRIGEEGTFEILGRLDISDLRGCNLLVGS